ncbi:hypothetical protein Hanom_Chr02g00134881 [Helianthus anomalus]
MFYIYCLFTGTSCGLHRCLAEYFTPYNKQQTHSRLYGGAFIMCIAQHCSRYFPFIGELPQLAPFEHLGIGTMIGMHIEVKFPDIGYRFLVLDDQIFVPQPFVHQGLLEAGEVEMPHVTDVPIGEGEIEPEVD